MTVNIQTKLSTGILGGLAGGVVFGFIMQAQGLLPIIARLIGSDSAFVGYIVHMLIAAFIGAVFGMVYGPAQTLGVALRSGCIYGLIWWVLGPQVIMPIWLGLPMPDTFGGWIDRALSAGLLWSLFGHLLYGMVSSVLGQVLQGLVSGLFLGFKERAQA
ncbi:hypothetical protein [Deinococcus roseus]|uniref:DUF1440 domain-containing protein n=1 Tax=Deinococcus roseus TaxID=392414 RepID=A0ABQ2CVC4_9DEIO|nr:hypothetical protein [Deinococcus roseus]GGJ23916.1 hypothetical protein GCM10008938_07630 [Deinococcus roseus]